MPVVFVEPGVNAGADADNPGDGASPLMLALCCDWKFEYGAPSSEIARGVGTGPELTAPLFLLKNKP